MSQRSEAWEAVLAALERLPGWEAARPQWNAQERLWSATAFYTGHVHVFDRRPTVVTRGMTEAEALPELAEVLRTR